MIEWVKDNGQEIETNDRKETIEHCEKLGWKRKGEQKETENTEAAPKKRGRPKKSEE